MSAPLALNPKEPGGKDAAKRAKEAEKLEKQRQKAKQNLQRQQEKEELKAEKQRIKELNQAEKQRIKELNQANKIRIDKLDMTKEMIIEVDKELMVQPLGALLREKFEAKLVTINSVSHDIPQIFSWRRKVTTDWSEEIGGFIPVEERIQEENHILAYLQMDELRELITNESLQTFHNNLQTIFVEKKIIYLIEGLQEYFRRKKAQKNRIFNNAVRSAIGESPENVRKPKKRNNNDQGPDQEKIEESLIWLQVVANCFIVHTNNLQESAEMIGILTTDIARIPYKNRSTELNFCIENQIRAGANASDTWFRMLQEIQLVTQPVAKAIVREYPTLKVLYCAYENCRSLEEAESLLAHVEITGTGLGHRNRYINKPLSKRIHDLFLGTNPDILIT
ncbi:hypothetical protein G9A89_020940 [Geosiphon pyriformis]|nr:hypothetical protein G9A89_020940 [Geosiphon pyriformis]